MDPPASVTGQGGAAEGRLAWLGAGAPTTSAADEPVARGVDALGGVTRYPTLDVAGAGERERAAWVTVGGVLRARGMLGEVRRVLAGVGPAAAWE